MYLRVVSDVFQNADGILCPIVNIQVIKKHNGDLVADVCVEIYDGKARVILTPAMVLRESEEATLAIDLVTGENIPL